jgi:hypothetical protein
VEKVLTQGRIVMSVYTVNNYSEYLPSHAGYRLKVISGNSSINRLSIVRESGENYNSTKMPDISLVISAAGHLSRLTDNALVSRLESLRGKERKIQLDILLYIVEVEKRKLYLLRGYNSLFEFCTRHLKYSASAAMRRIKASRCIKDFPVIKTMLLNGEIDLTSISRIERIIKKENSKDLLREIKNMTTRDVERVVARHCPRENYYDTIKPIFIRTNKASNSDRDSAGLKETESGKKVTTGAGSREVDLISETNTGLNLSFGKKDNKKEPEDTEGFTLEERFKLQFAVGPEFMQKLKLIKSLLSTRYPDGVNLEKLFNTLMEEYLERHSPEKRIERREERKNNKQNKKAVSHYEQNQRKKTNALENKQPPVGKDVNSKQKKGQESRQRINKETKNTNNKAPETNKQRSRNIPASVRDKVFARDGGKCTFVGENGKRCDSTWNIEIDHIVPFARGGNNSPGNLRLLCAKHNLMEAQRAYGEDFMKKYINNE